MRNMISRLVGALIVGMTGFLFFSTSIHAQLGASWAEATSGAQWSKRFRHASVVHAAEMWVIGGEDSVYKNDVWHSNNGVSWTMATSGAQWSPRHQHTSVAYDGKM